MRKAGSWQGCLAFTPARLLFEALADDFTTGKTLD